LHPLEPDYAASPPFNVEMSLLGINESSIFDCEGGNPSLIASVFQSNTDFCTMAHTIKVMVDIPQKWFYSYEDVLFGKVILKTTHRAQGLDLCEFP
jgi:hypothetical protein